MNFIYVSQNERFDLSHRRSTTVSLETRNLKTQTYALRFTGSDEAAKGDSFKIYMANNNIIFVQAASILFCYLTMES